MILRFSFAALLSSITLGLSAQTATLTVVMKNIEKAEGKLEVGLYKGDEHWLEDPGQYYQQILNCTDAPTVTITIPNVEYDTYGFTMYHDSNGNGKMDYRTWIPKEPFGFSNNPKAKWSKPSFEKCAFDINQPEVTIEVDVHGW